jgi:hypothetical protein
MSTDSISAPSTPPDAQENCAAWRAARAQWMAALEASLERSRKALLALDLAGIEAQTQVQAVLTRSFDDLMRAGLQLNAARASAVGNAGSPMASATSKLEADFRDNATRIVQSARLQAALLARSQQKLRVLARTLAGPSAMYGPFPEPNRHRIGRPPTANFCSLSGEIVTGESVTGERA